MWNNLPLVYGVILFAGLVAVFIASHGQLLKLQDINIVSGQSFDVKLDVKNTSVHDEISFVLLDYSHGQYGIERFFLHYYKNEGVMSGGYNDSRISFLGNASLEVAWIRFENVNINDSGTYGVLYKKTDSADVFISHFDVNVTQAICSNLKPAKNNAKANDKPSTSVNKTSSNDHAIKNVGTLISFDVGQLLLIAAFLSIIIQNI